MGRSGFIADEKLLTYLIELSKQEGFIPGLVLGQCSSQKGYVIHLSRTHLPEESAKPDGLENTLPSGDNLTLNYKKMLNFMDIEEKWLTSHSRTVTRMLPGGTWILGIFIVGPEDIFTNKNYGHKVSSLVTFVYNSTKNNPYLRGQPPNKNLVALFFNSVSKKYSCKLYDLENLNISSKPAEWKFQPNPLSWYEVHCCYDLGKISPFYLTKEALNRPLKNKLQEILKTVNDSVEKALCTIEGQFRENTLSLFELKKQLLETKKKDSDEEEKKEIDWDPFKANLYLMQEEMKEDEINVQVLKSMCDMECSGQLSSRVFLNQKATVEDAIKAVKEDIIRSWASRLEMHWDTYEEDTPHTNETMASQKEDMHMLPRRVTVCLPYVPVHVSEYLFPDEGAAEAIASIEENLCLHPDSSSLNLNFERPYGSNKESGKPEADTGARAVDTQETRYRRRSMNFMIVGIFLAALVLITSIAVQLTIR